MTDSPGPAPSPPESPRRRPRAWWWAVPAALVLLAGGVFAVGAWEHERWLDAVAAYEEEVAAATRDPDLARARAGAGDVPRLGALVAAETGGAAVLSGSEGQVDDPSLRDPLAAALGDGADLRTTPVEYPVEERTVATLTRPNPFCPASRPARDVAVVTGSVPSAGALDAAAAAVATTASDLARAQPEGAFDAPQTAAAEAAP